MKVTKEKTKGKHAMGMAAGQARLLSITSRLADNELRAQIINNNKMRLATESSQVSEAYVQALNDAQLMFTNYGADNSVSYQQLTFNAMTAYSPYNNQYILRNNAGNILVSETDAKNYEANKDNLKGFLACYDLKYTTNYFDKLQTGANVLAEFGNYAGINNGNVYFYAGDVDGDGKISVGDYQDSGFTQTAIQALYEGVKAEGTQNVTFLGDKIFGPDTNTSLESYADTLASQNYYDYFAALDKYTEKQDIYYQCIADLMDAKLDEFVNFVEESCSGLEAYKTQIESYTSIDDLTTNTVFDLINFILDEANTLTTTYRSDNTKIDPFIQTLKNRAEDYANGRTVSVDLDEDNTDEDVLSIERTVNITDNSFDDTVYLVTYNADGERNASTKQESNNTTGVCYQIINDTTTDYIIKREGTAKPYTYTVYQATKETDSSGNTIYTYETNATMPNINTTTDGTTGNITQFTYDDQISLNDAKSEAVEILELLKAGIYKIWDPTNSDFRNVSNNQAVKDRVDKAYSEYIEAAANLGNCIYGANSYTLSKSGAYYNNITVGTECPDIEYLDNISLLYNATATGGHNYDADGDGTAENHNFKVFDTSFYNVYKNILLDNIFASNGEPLYAWVDTNDSNENGEAKYNWYKNLFEQMSKGYETVTNGLASSPEWMKFAFESGMVTIEQLDSYGNWNRTVYTNCSDITEQTNDKAVAVAEAEYNAAMNKIENKDKRYDLELKNIDTEHNSLQTEYDSIKAAINKNIERTFKIYS